MATTWIGSEGGGAEGLHAMVAIPERELPRLPRPSRRA
jgi:hypothetical protein